MDKRESERNSVAVVSFKMFLSLLFSHFISFACFLWLLFSFSITGFPLDKAVAYSKLRNPFLINDLAMQYYIQDRYSFLWPHGMVTLRSRPLWGHTL